MKWVRIVISLLDKLAGKLSGGFLWLIGGGLLTMALLTTATAIARWLFNESITFSYEITIYIFVGVVLLGFAYVLRLRAHINVNIVFDRLPSRVKPWILFMNDIIVLTFGIVLTMGGIKLVTYSYKFHTLSITNLHVVMWIPQLVVPIGFGVFALEALVKVLKGPEHIIKKHSSILVCD